MHSLAKKYKIILALLLLLLVIAGIWICYGLFHKESYPYFYYDGYYYVGYAPVDSQAIGDPLYTVTRNTGLSGSNQNGDSNVLPEGTTIYTLLEAPTAGGFPCYAVKLPSRDTYTLLQPMIEITGGTVRQVTAGE